MSDERLAGNDQPLLPPEIGSWKPFRHPVQWLPGGAVQKYPFLAMPAPAAAIDKALFARVRTAARSRSRESRPTVRRVKRTAQASRDGPPRSDDDPPLARSSALAGIAR